MLLLVPKHAATDAWAALYVPRPLSHMGSNRAGYLQLHAGVRLTGRQEPLLRVLTIFREPEKVGIVSSDRAACSGAPEHFPQLDPRVCISDDGNKRTYFKFAQNTIQEHTLTMKCPELRSTFPVTLKSFPGARLSTLMGS